MLHSVEWWTGVLISAPQFGHMAIVFSSVQPELFAQGLHLAILISVMFLEMFSAVVIETRDDMDVDVGYFLS